MKQKNDKNIIAAIAKAASAGKALEDDEAIVTSENIVVSSVNELLGTVTGYPVDEDGSETMREASLRSVFVMGNKGIIIVPALNSVITICFLDGNTEQAVVVNESEVEKIVITVNTSVEQQVFMAPDSIIKQTAVGVQFGAMPTQGLVRGAAFLTWALAVNAALNSLGAPVAFNAMDIISTKYVIS